jgi:hypothetical protein
MIDLLNPDEEKPTPEQMLAYYYRRGKEDMANPMATFVSMNEQDFRMILAALGKSHDEVMSLGQIDNKIVRIEGMDPKWAERKTDHVR